jgi:hypothetical protein
MNVRTVAIPRPRLPQPAMWVAAAGISATGVGVASGISPLLGVALLATIIASYAVVRNPYVGVAILVALTPVTSGMRRGLIVPGLRPSETLVIWLVPLVVLGARTPVPRWGTLEWLGLAYAGGTLVVGGYDLWRRGGVFDASNVGGLLGPFQYLALLRAVRVGVTRNHQWHKLLALLLLTAVPISIFALLQGSGVAWAQHLSIRLTGVNLGHRDRATGFFTNWQVLAGYLVAVGLLGTAVVAFQARRVLSPRLASITLLIIIAGLARTLTIGAFAGWAAGSFVLVMWAGRIKVTGARFAGAAAIAVVLLSLVFAARYEQEFAAPTGQATAGLLPSTIVGRYDNWVNEYLPALSGRWVTGFGPGIPSSVSWKYTDSVYLTLVLHGGLILLALYVALMCGVVVSARTAYAVDSESGALIATVIVLVGVLAVIQTIATYFTTSGLPQVVWIMVALVTLLPVTGRRRLRV